MSESIKNKFNSIITTAIILLGVILRLKTYYNARPLWHDEASLASSIINRGILGFFTPLDFLQKAPPLFMSATKAVTIFLGESETALRLLPFLASIISLGLFYIVSKKVLNSPYSVIIANFLFAINYELIYYGQEFKQYSTDVLAILGAFILYEKLDFNNLPYKDILKYSAISIILILFSHPMIIVIAAIIILNLIKAKKENIKKYLAYILPILICGAIYCLKILLPTKNQELALFNNYWDSGFITLNIFSMWDLLKTNFVFYFQPNNFSIMSLVLFITGAVLFEKEDKKNQQFIFLIIFIAFVASLLHLYPIKERVSLYLLPLTIFFIAKPFDLISKNRKAISLIILILFMTAFNQYHDKYLKMFFQPNIFKMQDSRTAMQVVTNNFKPNDCFVYNDASRSDYAYYSKYFNFYPDKTILLTLGKYDKKEYFKHLDDLPKNQNYWFYYPYDYYSRPVRFFLKEWAKKQNKGKELKEFKYKRSYALYLQR